MSDTDTGKRPLQVREWIMIIGLIVLFMLVVGSWTVNAVPDDSVINFVSFAGTITSITLALLAIIYSYFQGFAQQRSAKSITSEIGRLEKTVRDIETSEDSFSKELSKLDNISEQLSDAIPLVEKSHESVLKTQREVESFSKEFDGFDTLKTEGEKKAEGLATLSERGVVGYLESSNAGVQASLAYICIFEQPEHSMSEMSSNWASFLLALSLKDSTPEEDADLIYGMLFGAIRTFWRSLISLGIVERVNGEYKLHEGVFVFLRNLKEQHEDEETTSVRLFWKSSEVLERYERAVTEGISFSKIE